MLLTSTENPQLRVSWRDAVLSGLSSDGGLYIPVSLPHLGRQEMDRLAALPFHMLCAELASAFLADEVPQGELQALCQEAFCFDLPIMPLSANTSVLELFHGPTCAFKDFGARFMARLFRIFWGADSRRLTVLVATSGDTGSAVANAFFDPNPDASIQVHVLFPRGKVSLVQERQMTTLGGNVTAYEVDGSFDDCQRLVKQALADRSLLSGTALTSANSINIARLLPQMFYYVHAALRLQSTGAPIVSVPSGNLGNITGGLLARIIGAPLGHFVAALNANSVFSNYLQNGIFTPQPSLETLSNAMDVGNPSNFARISSLFGGSVERIRRDISACSVSEADTLATIRSTYEHSGYILDPHTAVGVCALERLRTIKLGSQPGLVLATAHPAKFADVVRRAIGIEPAIPAQLAAALGALGSKHVLKNSYSELRAALVGCYVR